MTALVDITVDGEFVDRHMNTQDMPVRLVYEDNDQLAVTMTLGGQTWRFSRDLLALGLTKLAGEGSIQVEPGRKIRPGQPALMTVVITLAGVLDNGAVATGKVRLSHTEVSDFCRRSYEAVPLLREQVDVDGALERIFAEAGQ